MMNSKGKTNCCIYGHSLWSANRRKRVKNKVHKKIKSLRESIRNNFRRNKSYKQVSKQMPPKLLPLSKDKFFHSKVILYYAGHALSFSHPRKFLKHFCGNRCPRIHCRQALEITGFVVARSQGSTSLKRLNARRALVPVSRQ